MDNENFIRGAIYGHLVGDAVGFPLKNISKMPEQFDMFGTTNFVKGTCTDASCMMLCTIASINECRSIYVEEILDKLQDWYVGGYLACNQDCIEIKPNVIQTLVNYTNGFPPDRCGLHDEHLNNNASLIRILPIAIFLAHKSIDDLIETIHIVSAATNPQLKNQICCVLYGLLVRSILLNKKEKVFELLKDYYQTKRQSNRLQLVDSVLSWKKDNTPQGTDNILDSFWSSWTAYSQNQDSYYECVKYAAKLGNSSDDTCCLSGALSGLSLGFEEIPEQWINNLQIHFEAIDEIEKFINLTKREIN